MPCHARLLTEFRRIGHDTPDGPLSVEEKG
jgi:hypothetical protein